MAAFATLATTAQALSFGGDWSFSYNAVLNYNTSMGSGGAPSSSTDLVTATQPDSAHFAFPYSVGPIAGQGDFTVSGITVTDVNTGKTTSPFLIDFNGSPVQVRLTYPVWNLTGNVTGINNTVVDAFGARAHHIDGDPVTISNVKIEAFLFGGWQDLGTNNNIVVSSWSMDRDAVPEPATLSILGVVGIVGIRRRRV